MREFWYLPLLNHTLFPKAEDFVGSWEKGRYLVVSHIVHIISIMIDKAIHILACYSNMFQNGKA